ncbi:MAG: T9SS type A sorting domain-containing protein [Flavobacteriales bacterium]
MTAVNGNRIIGRSGVSIVQDPGNCKKYYIFAADGVPALQPGFGEGDVNPYYAILDLELPRSTYNTSRMGELLMYPTGETALNLSSLPPAYNDNHGSGKNGGVMFAITPLNANKEHFIFVSTAIGNIRKYVLSPSGLTHSGQGFYSLDGTTLVPNTSTWDHWTERGELEVIPYNGGYRIAGTIKSDHNGVFVADLNASGNLIAGTHQPFFYFEPTQQRLEIRGVEFSPSGEYLYLTHNVAANAVNFPFPVEYINISTGTSSPLLSIPLSEAMDFRFSQLEVAVDGKLYMATADRLATLTNPNNPASATWNNSAISITYNLSDLNFKTAYLLPNQIDGQACVTGCFDCTLNEGDKDNCCPFFAEFTFEEKDPFVATTTATWSPGAGNNPFGSITGEVYVNQDIIIPHNTVVRIQGMTFYFSPTSRVVVQRGLTNTSPGGKLILDNTVFTADNRCGECYMWPGVQVWGHNNVNQGIVNLSPTVHTSPQGALYMVNNSKIEHAYTGAKAYRQYPTTAIDLSHGGGVIIAAGSTFRNNQRDVELRSYPFKNISRFTLTKFTTDGLLNKPGVSIIEHAFLAEVDNINFFGCEFKNYTPELFGQARGNGILALRARFFVDEQCVNILNCSNTIPSVFENLRGGVIASSSNPLITFKVDRSRFINNFTGIFSSGINNLVVQRNQFEVYRSLAPNFTLNTLGLHLVTCSGYKVMENDFTEFNDPDVTTPGGNTYGIVVDNSGVLDNEIYKNTFHGIRVGGQSQKINSEVYDPALPNPNNIGLRWKCNTFFDDIYQADLGVASGRIAYQQGHCLSHLNPDAVKTPAGNKFSHSTFNPTNDIWVNTGVLSFNYAHHADLITTPLYYTPIAVPQQCSGATPIYFDETNSCPTKIRTLPTVNLISFIGSQMQIIKDEIAIKEELIDGGDTDYLLQQISGNLPAGELKDLLLAASPYLTDDVILAYIATNPAAGHLNQIIGANSPVSSQVWNAVSAMNIPNGIKKQLSNAQTGVSAMTYLINEMDEMRVTRESYIDELLSIYLLDTLIEGRLDSVIVILREEGRLERTRQLCDAYLLDGDLTRADSTRTEIVNETGHDNFCRMVTYSIDAANHNCPAELVATDPVQRQAVEDIANDPNDRTNCVRAEAILSMAFDMNFNYQIEPLIASNHAPVFFSENKVDEWLKEPVRLFPNPTNEELYIVINEESEYLQRVTVAFFNIMGQQVYSLNAPNGVQTISVMLDSLPSGIYLVAVSVNGVNISTQKVTVK